MDDELLKKMKKLIAEKLEVEEDKITMESSFRQDLGADSLDMPSRKRWVSAFPTKRQMSSRPSETR